MSDLSNAVNKTMNFVFAELDTVNNEKKKRLEILKSSIGKIANIPLDEIETDQNIRNEIDVKSESFLRLVESIKKYGILENIVVELKVLPKEGEYKLICVAGHRRILAAKKIQNITKIPCLIQSFSKSGDNIGAALTENLNREDLHCIDIADGYQALIKNGWEIEEISKYFDRDIRTIKHYLKIASWSNDVKKIIRTNPEVYSTRVIFRNFAYKKFDDNKDLRDAILAYKNNIENKTKNKKSKKLDSDNNKSEIRKSLKKYLFTQKTLSSIIKEEIEKAFIALGLI